MGQKRRIYITGGPGVGKTTLARRLADATGFPMFELDSLLWTHSGTGERIEDKDRIKIVGDIAGRSNWIADGVYVGWAQQLWREADLVIYLDISLKLVLWRVFWRHVKAEFRRNNRHPGWLKLFRFMRIIVKSHRSDEIGNIDDDEDKILTHAKIAAKIRQQNHKAVVYDRTSDFKQILALIRTT